MSEVRILLINHRGYVLEDMLDLPLGLMYLSSYVKAHIKDCEVKIITSIVDFKSHEELMGIINSYEPEIIGMRGISVYLNQLIDCASYINREYVDKAPFKAWMLAGGPVACANTEALAESGCFDYIVTGDGEEPFLEIVNSYIDAKRAGALKNVGSGERKAQVLKGFVEDLDALPIPDYSAVTLDEYAKYLGINSKRNRHAQIFSSRGCPYHCAYYHKIFGKKTRLRSVDNVLDEIKFLKDTYGMTDFCIIDDIFNFDYDRAIRIFDRIIKEELNIRIFFPNGIRGDIIDERYIDYMAAAGTSFVAYAAETGSPRLQRLIKKHINLERLRQNVIYTAEKNIFVSIFFMMGFPSETVEDVLETFRYIESLGTSVLPLLFQARYYEGTDLYNLAVEHGFTEEMIQKSREALYYNPSAFRTPTIDNGTLVNLRKYFIYKIACNGERIENLMRILRIHYTEDEMIDFFNYFYPFNIKSIGHFIKRIDIINRAAKNRKSIYGAEPDQDLEGML